MSDNEFEEIIENEQELSEEFKKIITEEKLNKSVEYFFKKLTEQSMESNDGEIFLGNMRLLKNLVVVKNDPQRFGEFIKEEHYDEIPFFMASLFVAEMAGLEIDIIFKAKGEK